MSSFAHAHKSRIGLALTVSLSALFLTGYVAVTRWLVNDAADKVEDVTRQSVTKIVSSQQMVLSYHLKELLNAPEPPKLETLILYKGSDKSTKATAGGKTHEVSRMGRGFTGPELDQRYLEIDREWAAQKSPTQRAFDWIWGRPDKRISAAGRYAVENLNFNYNTVFFDDRAETTYSGLSLNVCQQRLQVADQMGTPATYGAPTQGVPMKLHTPGDFAGVNVCDTVVVVVPK